MEKKYTTFEPQKAEALKQIEALNGCSFVTLIEYPDNPAIFRVKIEAEPDWMNRIYKEGFSSENPLIYKVRVDASTGIPAFVQNKFDEQAFKTAAEAKEWCDKVASELGAQYSGIISSMKSL